MRLAEIYALGERYRGVPVMRDRDLVCIPLRPT